jgi:hypothetical protein
MAYVYWLKGRGSGEVLVLSYREFYNLQRLGGVEKPYLGEGTFPEDEVLSLAHKIEEQLPAIEEREQALMSVQEHTVRSVDTIADVPAHHGGLTENIDEDEPLEFFAFNRGKLSRFVRLARQEKAFDVCALLS